MCNGRSSTGRDNRMFLEDVLWIVRTARHMTHMFDLRCSENGIEHRLTKPCHPWTNGQAERMNRTIEGLTPYEYVCAVWTKEPDRFNLNPPISWRD